MSDISNLEEDMQQFMHDKDDRLDLASDSTDIYNPPSDPPAEIHPPAPRTAPRNPEIITGYTQSEVSERNFINNIFETSINFQDHPVDGNITPMDQNSGVQPEGSVQPNIEQPQGSQSSQESSSISTSPSCESQASAHITRTQYLDRRQQDLRNKFSSFSPTL